MKGILKFQGILFVISLFSINAFTQSAREISEKASDVIDFKSMEMISTLKIIDKKAHERLREIVIATNEFNKLPKTIIKFTAPADVKGTTMLVYDNKKQDDDMWIYLPALRKTRRIVSSEKGNSFMGSEFTNADMGKPNMDDFTYNLLPDAILNGKACWVIESVCKNEDIEDANGFSRQVSWIEKETYLCHKIEFYDIDNELHRIQTIKDYRKQSNGSYFAFYIEKENVQNGRKSIMTIDKFQENCTMPESSFSPNRFEK